MRAGLSELEAEDIYASNALFLTNRENSLVDEAQQAIVDACQKMKDAGQSPTVAYHSLAANGMDTGDLVARTLLLARDRLLPEFTYLDPRGIGLWDGTSYSTTRLAVAAMDFQEAGALGTGGRPPANEDGTPNETLADQFIRLRQFFSLQESRTSGENILVIFPDGTGPALASAMIAGLPLNTCHALEFAPGEIRLDITQKSVLQLYNEKKDDPAYLEMLEQGQEYLQALRKESTTNFVNRKDKLAEERRLEADRVFAREQQRKQREAEQQRQEALAKLRQEEQRAKEERLRLRQEQQQQKRENTGNPTAMDGLTAVEATRLSKIDPITTVAGLGVAAAGVALVNGGNVAKSGSSDGEEEFANGNGPTSPSQPDMAKSGENGATTMEASGVYSNNTSSSISLNTEPIPQSSGKESVSVEKELESLEDAQRRFMTSLADTTATSPPSEVAADVQTELDTLERGQATLNTYLTDDSYFDDGADDWLRVLAEIRDESDDEI